MTDKKFNWFMFSFTILVLISGIAIGYQSGRDMDNGIYRVVYEPITTADGVPCKIVGQYLLENESFTVQVEGRAWSEVMETCSHEYLHYRWSRGHFD